MMSRTRAEIGSSGGNRMRERCLGTAGGGETDKAGGVFSLAATFSPSLAEAAFRIEIFSQEDQKIRRGRREFWVRAAARRPGRPWQSDASRKLRRRKRETPVLVLLIL
jgi:hypothetical protein